MKPQGLYITPTDFVRFAEPAQRLSDHIATRERSPDFMALGMLLPNPDPILKKQGKDISVYTELRSDAHVGGCIRRRKAAVQAMEWRVERGKASARGAKLAQEVLSGLDLRNLIQEMLNAPLFGWQPLEVIWTPASTGPIVPAQVLAKPINWFHYDEQAQLRFKSREQPLHGETVAARKFLVPAQEASYANPYGFADLSMCFWPTVFKRGGLKFWVTFTEKFGTPWVIGKTPRGTTGPDQDKLLDQLEAMVQDAVAVIPDDASVDIAESGGKSASADLYERLLMFCRSEVSIALLGQNQSTEASANRASAQAGLEVTQDLRDGDARLVEAAVNQLLRWVVDLNEGEAAPAPKFELFEQEEVNEVQAKRDKLLSEAGVSFTPAYWQRSYGLEDSDLAAASGGPDGGVSAAFAEASAAADLVRQETEQLMAATAPEWAAMVDQLQALVVRSDSLAQVQQALVQAYGALDSEQLVKLMAAALALAELKGLAAAQAEG